MGHTDTTAQGDRSPCRLARGPTADHAAATHRGPLPVAWADAGHAPPKLHVIIDGGRSSRSSSHAGGDHAGGDHAGGGGGQAGGGNGVVVRPVLPRALATGDAHAQPPPGAIVAGAALHAPGHRHCSSRTRTRTRRRRTRTRTRTRTHRRRRHRRTRTRTPAAPAAPALLPMAQVITGCIDSLH